jgi:hypothetical protein
LRLESGDPILCSDIPESAVCSEGGRIVSHPREICVNCHFLAGRTLRAVGVPPNCLTEEERAPLRTGDYSIVKSGTVLLNCHLGVWSLAAAAGQNDVVGYLTPQIRKEIFDTDRRGFCFYLPHHPGMGLAAAERIEKRQTEAKESSEDRKLTQQSLRIAVIALLIQSLLSAASMVASWLKP